MAICARCTSYVACFRLHVHHADAGYWQVVIGVGVAVAVAFALNLNNTLQPATATSLWQLTELMIKVKS